VISNDRCPCLRVLRVHGQRGCDKVMELPDTDAIDTGMEEPFWYHEEVHTYIGGNYDKYHAYCKSCYDEKLEEMQE
jgi:thymidine kinase